MSESSLSGESARQIRGSSVLFVGRVLALGIGLATQVLLVRGLSRTGYGAFAFALALSTSARTIVSVGEDQAFTRFITLYDERREYGKMFGTYAMALAKIAFASALLIAALLVWQEPLTRSLIDDPQAIDLLLILIFLAPIDAIDRLFEGSFAVFSRARAIFFRKYVLEPGLRLAAVGLLVLLGRDAAFVAVGYVVGAFIGLIVYAVSLRGVLRDRGLLGEYHRGDLSFPLREYFGFSLPLLTTELVNLSMNTATVLLLGRYAGTNDVAGFRAVLPVARLNQLVIFTFTMLFTPMAGRFFARQDNDAMRHAYWQTAGWLAVMTFPVAAATVALAGPVTTTLFGSRYADAGAYLAWLSAGYYVNASLGFNALTLQTWGRLRWVVTVNIVAAGLNIGLGAVLIPRHGALGAALSVATALVVQNLLNQLGLRTLHIPILDRAYAPLYATLAAAATVVGAMQLALDPPLVVGLGFVAAISLVVLRLTRTRLDVAGTFPELAAIPVVSKVLGP